jgi:hypothetical protein
VTIQKPDMPVWISDNGISKMYTPPVAKQLAGFLYQEDPIAQMLNWLMNRYWRWTRGTQGAFYDYVVGTTAQVGAGQATHTVTQLLIAMGGIVDGAKILFLEGDQLAGANLTFTNNNLTIVGENPGAILDLTGGFSFTVNGSNCFIGLNFANAGAGAVSIQGNGSSLFCEGLPLTSVSLGPNAGCQTVGVGGGILNPVISGGTQTNATYNTPTISGGQISNTALNTPSLTATRMYVPPNIQALSADRVLTDADAETQLFDPLATTRNVTLPGSVAGPGRLFTVCHNGTGGKLVLKASGGATVCEIFKNGFVSYGSKSATPANATDWQLQARSRTRYVFTGTGTLPLPIGVDTFYASGWGGGGGGGNGDRNGNGGGGGAGGKYAWGTCVGTPGETITVTIGGGGGGGPSSPGRADGGGGGTTTVAGSVSGSLLAAGGGAGGEGAAASNQGVGAGWDGSSAYVVQNHGGNGGILSTTTNAVSGGGTDFADGGIFGPTGGTSTVGGGGGGAGRGGGAPGGAGGAGGNSAGGNTAAGGGGAGDSTNANLPGGNGGSGYCEVLV